ncbi:hypothetical protein [Pontibacter chinhatensis]|uniref:hypothetical protein n=1 Tax=Pontibacter chinhatensis TaxID=1436961 RepID=UPI000B858E06|nr:hypothetical protein [Pontibacter chinhatensis]
MKYIGTSGHLRQLKYSSKYKSITITDFEIRSRKVPDTDVRNSKQQSIKRASEKAARTQKT